MITIKGNQFITPYRVLENAYIQCEEKILSVTEDKPEILGECIDLSGLYVTPGFIDLHIHGGGGHEFWTDDPKELVEAAKFHGRHGVTALVPTVNYIEALDVTEEMKRKFRAFNQAKNTKEACPEFLGLHMEGPNTSMNRKVLPEQEKQEVSLEGYLKVIKECGNVLRWTLAPELDGIQDIISEITKHGVYVSLGHCEPSYEQILEACKRGATHVTHIYSGMNSVERKEGKRYAGLVETALLSDMLYVEMIANGTHLSPELMHLIYKVKGKEHICIISDATSMTGHKDGMVTYKGKQVEIKDHVILNETHTGFYGSVVTFDEMLRELLLRVKVPICDAIQMCSTTPAKSVGLGDRKGVLEEGFDADIIAFDEDINIKFVMTRGKILYNALQEK